MSDIHDCQGCGEKVYMDNAEHCVVCSSWFCGACDYKNGEKLWDDENENCYYVCKDCLEQGLDYINEDNEDDTIFTKGEYDKAIEKLNKRI
ncbi:TPA: hypothetical protein ACXDAY_002253 [Clostridium botulinum]|uniref:hypothetical protein n=1 Tax=Clostridium botulinum TaxID=1491 RepID=UPI0007746052|nr:hypothetical protein [Clostridium botulinum]APH20971.1 hypothetical protein NPD1_4117 [Clostridium botulinum]APQ71304.1 hypothetical protein RSJ8_4074 [Clostridium botulinum]MBN3352043.1 hypothetical protein [Clostridium botulinum]MBN3359185.1 hypothetical protein [Clostridium botulinum]MBN3379069.1 hypothetical protein [Clostridium botulinum]